jgi:hypothetical protein
LEFGVIRKKSPWCLEIDDSMLVIIMTLQSGDNIEVTSESKQDRSREPRFIILIQVYSIFYLPCSLFFCHLDRDLRRQHRDTLQGNSMLEKRS